jgi:predicted HicB family RNase H-like nuclease
MSSSWSIIPISGTVRHGERLLALFRQLFHTIHRREDYASDATFRRQLERLRNEICYQAGMELPNTQEAGNLAERFHLHVDSYFRFITEPGIDPTNNLAEQAIRFVAIHRRLTQGTGARTAATGSNASQP